MILLGLIFSLFDIILKLIILLIFLPSLYLHEHFGAKMESRLRTLANLESHGLNIIIPAHEVDILDYANSKQNSFGGLLSLITI